MYNVHRLLVFVLYEFILAFMYLSLYNGSVSNYFLNKQLISFHISLYFCNVSLSLTKSFTHLISLKYFTYAFMRKYYAQ